MFAVAARTAPLVFRNHGSKKFFKNYSRAVSFRLNESLAAAVFLGLVSVMAIFYLLEVNSITSLGYQYKDYEKKLTELKKDNQNLKVDVASVTSIYKLDSDVSVLGLVSIKGAKYLTIQTPETARR